MTSLIWFRNDLRTTDHHPLVDASEDGAVCGVYCFDPRHYEDISYGFPKTDAIRTQFLIDSVADLKTKLQELGSDLIIKVGKPEDVLPLLIEETQAEQLIFHGEVAPEERKVEKYVEETILIPMKR